MVFEEFILGKRHRLSWIAEATFGAGGTMENGEIVGLDARIEPDFNQNWQEILQAGADDRYVQGAALGPLDLPFTLTFTPVNFVFLKYCGYSVVDGVSSPYTHTFTIANSIMSFELEWVLRHTTDVAVTLTGCTVLGASIIFQKGTGEGGEGFISVALRCVAKAYTLGATESVIAAGDIDRTPFQWQHITLDFDNNEIAEINNGELIIEQGIDVNDSRYCNSTLGRAIGEPIPKVHRISGRFNANMKDNTFMAAWDTAAVIANCGLDLVQNATNNKLVSTFTNFRMSQGNPPTVLDGVTNVDIPFTAESFASLVATDLVETY